MTFAELIDDLMVASILLLVGYILRELTPLRRLYLSAAIIGGVIMLILGPQVLDIIAVPIAFKQFATPLTSIIFSAALWGVTVNFDRVKVYLDYTLIQFTTIWWQIGLGSLVGIICALFWPDLPTGWGLMAPFAFFSGHGTATAMGTLFATDYGIEGNLDLGIILATVGLVCAMVIGSIIVIIGIKRGAATFVNSDSEIKKEGRGLLPEPNQTPIGFNKVQNAAISNYLFQFSMVLFVLWFGTQMIKILCKIPGIQVIASNLPPTIYGILGALVLWPICRKLKLDGYVDRQTVSSISGLSVDLLVLSAVGTLNLNFLSKFWLPILIISIIVVGFTIFFVFFMSYKCCRVEWFEKAVFTYGLSTGVVATGFSLHKMVDPNSESIVPEAQGVCSGITAPIYFPLYVVFVMLAATAPGKEVWLAFAMSISLTVVSWILLRKGVKSICNR